MFYGEYVHAVDAKKRIRIPTRFKLEKGEDYVFTVTREGVISVYSEKIVNEKFACFGDVSPFDDELNDMVGDALAGFYPATEDAQGRVMIPEPIRRMVNVGSEVVTVGMGDHVDVMSVERREEMRRRANSPEARRRLNELYAARKNGN